jgi:hypothetical protein
MFIVLLVVFLLKLDVLQNWFNVLGSTMKIHFKIQSEQDVSMLNWKMDVISENVINSKFQKINQWKRFRQDLLERNIALKSSSRNAKKFSQKTTAQELTAATTWNKDLQWKRLNVMLLQWRDVDSPNSLNVEELMFTKHQIQDLNAKETDVAITSNLKELFNKFFVTILVLKSAKKLFSKDVI